MIPRHLQEFVPLFQASAAKHSHRYQVRAVVLAAICDRESLGGRALKPQGPAGTGDWKPRSDAKYGRDARFTLVGTREKNVGDKVMTLPLYMPADGKGFGRGLMQIDFYWHIHWCHERAPDGRFLWEISEHNIDHGALTYSLGLEQLDGSEDAAVCAYNAGIDKTWDELANITSPSNPDAAAAIRRAALDRICTGGDYVTDVLERVEKFEAPHDPAPPVRPKGLA